MAIKILQNEISEEVMATPEHGEIGAILTGHLFNHVYPNKLGRLFIAQTSFDIPPDGKEKQPDVSFVAAGRLRTAATLAPDLAVKIVSPTDTAFGIEEKVIQYQQAGVRLIWVIYPTSQTVAVYRLTSEIKPQILQGSEELDGDDVIPGFRLKVSALFE